MNFSEFFLNFHIFDTWGGGLSDPILGKWVTGKINDKGR